MHIHRIAPTSTNLLLPTGLASVLGGCMPMLMWACLLHPLVSSIPPTILHSGETAGCDTHCAQRRGTWDLSLTQAPDYIPPIIIYLFILSMTSIILSLSMSKFWFPAFLLPAWLDTPAEQSRQAVRPQAGATTLAISGTIHPWHQAAVRITCQGCSWRLHRLRCCTFLGYALPSGRLCSVPWWRTGSEEGA